MTNTQISERFYKLLKKMQECQQHTLWVDYDGHIIGISIDSVTAWRVNLLQFDPRHVAYHMQLANLVWNKLKEFEAKDE